MPIVNLFSFIYIISIIYYELKKYVLHFTINIIVVKILIEMIMMDDKLNALNTFFQYDLEIKTILVELALKNQDFYNVQYGKYFNRQITILNDYFQKICLLLNRDDLLENINNYFTNLHYLFDKIGDDMFHFQEFYATYFSDMRREFIDFVGNNIFGYRLEIEEALTLAIQKAQTVNELLHAFHSYVVNTEIIYQDLPVLAKDQNGYSPFTLYGKENPIAQQLFNKIPRHSKIGITDIIALNENKILIMIRGLGHALTLEMEIGSEESFVSYYIPKINNVFMINDLKGVKKVKYDANYNPLSRFTVGQFNVKNNELVDELINFFMKVPTDDDNLRYKSGLKL